MESEGMIHDHGKRGKSSRSEVAELKETIITGMRILGDAAFPEGGSEADETSHQTKEAIDILCERALSGDQKSLAQLRDAAQRVLASAGSLDTSSRVSGARVSTGKRRRSGGKRRAPVRKIEKKLPDHPLSAVDLPESLPEISLDEIGEFVQARNTFLLAKADYERRRAELVYKLRMLCAPEDVSKTADYLLKLDGDGDTLIITDQTSIPVEVVIDRR